MITFTHLFEIYPIAAMANNLNYSKNKQEQQKKSPQLQQSDFQKLLSKELDKQRRE